MTPEFAAKQMFSTRLEGLGTTIFAEMTAMAAATRSINLGQGYPDVDGPDIVVEAAVEALRSGRGNQYPPGLGVLELREAVVEHQYKRYGLNLDPDREVLITAGATEAIAAALLAIIEPGDEVIALEPYYDSYAACVSMAGGRRVPVALTPPNFGFDLDRLRSAITPRTKMLLINSPHNPTGTVLTGQDLAGIAELACTNDLIVAADEVYEHITYDGIPHVPLSSLPGMWERTITISSAGKTFALTGWKIGWVTAPNNLIAAVRTAKQFLTYVSGGPFQYAFATALKQLPTAYYEGLRMDLQRKRDKLCEGLAQLGYEVTIPTGTYFATVDIRPLGYSDGMAFCRALPSACGVVAIPSVVFYDDKLLGAPYVRFAFCKREAVLDEALNRLSCLQ